MCNVPDVGGFLSDPLGTIGRGATRVGRQFTDPEELAEGLGVTSENLGLPTTAELTGAEAAKEAERAQQVQAAEFATQQAQAVEERARRSRELATSGGRAARGRASTLLTGPRGLSLDSGTGASRTLLGG
jgi:hypothetical protein